jgi:Protein of unknown function (DUF3822)
LSPSTSTYKLLKKIKDEKFDEDDLHHYVLLIQLGVRDLQIGVTDTRNNRFLFFEDYILGEVKSSAAQLEVLKVLFESHPLLMAGFWEQVRFSIKNSKFVQIPAALFVEGGAAEYLSINTSIDKSSEDVVFCKNQAADIVTVFGIYRELRTWITNLYPNSVVKFDHQSASLIEGVLSFASAQGGNPLYLYVDRFRLHILAAKVDKLVYYNQFPIRQFADYVKYIMLVLSALQMSQQSSRVIVWGYIGKSSPHADEFSKYIRNVSFGVRPNKLKFGYMFDEVQEHHFFDLYGLYLMRSSH